MTFQFIFNVIKGATKDSQSLYKGCTDYNLQYSASVVRSTKETYFPVTNTQANDLSVGSSVSVGYGQLFDTGTEVNIDPEVTNMHKYAKIVKILNIETLDDNNKAVYLDVDTGFDTTPIVLSDTVTSDIIMSTMPWYSGSTDSIIGHHDGSPISNTDWKHVYRVQGREYRNGTYEIASDIVTVFKSDYSKDVYVCPKGIARSSDEATIKKTYTKIGNIPASIDGEGSDWWIGDLTIDTSTGAWFPSAIGASDKQGIASKLYSGGTYTSGTREYLQGGYLGDGSSAGFHLRCWLGLGGALWLCGCRD